MAEKQRIALAQPMGVPVLDVNHPLFQNCIFSWDGHFPKTAHRKAYFRSGPSGLVGSISASNRFGPIKASNFNGSSGYVSLDDTPAVDFATAGFAFETLFRTTSVSIPQFILGKDQDGITARQFFLSINEETRNGHVRIGWFSADSKYCKVETPTNVIVANRWHHVFAHRVQNSSSYTGLAIYVDGVYMTPTQGATVGSPTSTVQATGTELCVGRRTYSGNFNYFSGDIALVRIYSNTPADCSQLAKDLGSNPWAMYLKDTRKVFFQGIAAAVPTLSSSTYKPGTLTTDGWQPRVTAT